MLIGDWSSAVCSSDLRGLGRRADAVAHHESDTFDRVLACRIILCRSQRTGGERQYRHRRADAQKTEKGDETGHHAVPSFRVAVDRKEHTSELQSLMRISYAVFCLKNKNKQQH